MSEFCQRHHTETESPYCPSWPIRQTEGLVRSPVTLDLIRQDVKSFLPPSPPPLTDGTFKDVIRDPYRAFKITAVKPIHLNDLPKILLDTLGSSPGLPWKAIGYNSKGEVLRDKSAFQSVRKFWHRIK